MNLDLRCSGHKISFFRSIQTHRPDAVLKVVLYLHVDKNVTLNSCMPRSTPESIHLVLMNDRQRPRLNAAPDSRSLLRSHAAAFFVLGLLNNMMYVVILTAALELLPSRVPTGVLAFVNITPALVAKAVFPYWLRGEIRYHLRVWLCTLLAFAGMLSIALVDTLFLRLLGIAIASFASGLGEITYLQYSTRYVPQVTTYCVGWFASGTGAAGLVGASAWWIVRPLGVRLGLSLLAFLSFGTAISFFCVLPEPKKMPVSVPSEDESTEALMLSLIHI